MRSPTATALRCAGQHTNREYLLDGLGHTLQAMNLGDVCIDAWPSEACWLAWQLATCRNSQLVCVKMRAPSVSGTSTTGPTPPKASNNELMPVEPVQADRQAGVWQLAGDAAPSYGYFTKSPCGPIWSEKTIDQ